MSRDAGRVVGSAPSGLRLLDSRSSVPGRAHPVRHRVHRLRGPPSWLRGADTAAQGPLEHRGLLFRLHGATGPMRRFPPIRPYRRPNLSVDPRSARGVVTPGSRHRELDGSRCVRHPEELISSPRHSGSCSPGACAIAAHVSCPCRAVCSATTPPSERTPPSFFPRSPHRHPFEWVPARRVSSSMERCSARFRSPPTISFRPARRIRRAGQHKQRTPTV
jgi:hypothetical protein